jgi:23S rRNA (adenine2503-C2)-methyltransferase
MSMNTLKKNIKNFSLPELKMLVRELGEPEFRAAQLHRWLYSEHTDDFMKMSNIGRTLREKLAERFSLPSCSIVQVSEEENDTPSAERTTKFLVRLHDSEAVETVLIPATGRQTVCVSTQVGCPLHCRFCATGYMGFTRNLSAAEIAEQVYAVQGFLDTRHPDDRLTNIVYMGMGEPLLNLDNVIESVHLLSHQGYRVAFSQKRITISTVGLTGGIERLATSDLNTRLAISLHSALQHKRLQLIPSARENPLEDLARSIRRFTDAKESPVTLVYMLLEDFNDSRDDALALARFAGGLLCKINLIDYNAIVNIKFESTGTRRRDAFIQTLLDKGLQVTVRRSHGSSINAACGQLAIQNRPSQETTL